MPCYIRVAAPTKPNPDSSSLSSGHLPQKQPDYRKRYRTLASTYLTFSPDGAELLVNLGGEQIYLFDVNRARKPHKFDIPIVPPAAAKLVTGTTQLNLCVIAKQ